MPTFKNMKQFEKWANKQIANVLENEVAEKVKDVMQDKIQSEVYDAYTSNSTHPDAYERRYDNDGLSDRGNMPHEVNANVLVVRNITRGQDTGMLIGGLIEYGHNNGHGIYDYPWTASGSVGDFRGSRPFMFETIEAFRRGNLGVIAMKKGLKRLGIDTV